MTAPEDQRGRDELTPHPHERRLNAEAAVRLVAVFALVFGVCSSVSAMFDLGWFGPDVEPVYGPVALVLGAGIWKHRNWARWLAVVAMLSICAYPPTSRQTPLMFLCFFLLFRRDAQRVFEPEYREVMAREPELSPSIYNVLPWALLGLALGSAEALAWWGR